ncbi:MAG: LLM class flavin-dependent oxidoreductase [Thermomicrobiales bacterium]
MAGMPKVGVIVPEAENDLEGRTPRWSDYVAMARAIEDLGYDSLWFVDHYIYKNDASGLPPQGAWECWSMLAALAAATSRVELGSLVTATSFQPHSARQDGGHHRRNQQWPPDPGHRRGLERGGVPHVRVPLDHRFDRFREAFTILHNLLRDGVVDFEGTYYTARECELRPRGPRAGGPPIMIGSRGPKMLAATLPHVPM